MKLSSTTAALFALLPALALAQDGPGGPNPLSEIPDNPAITGGEPAHDAPPIPSSTVAGAASASGTDGATIPIPVPMPEASSAAPNTSVPVLPPLPHLNLTGSDNDTAITGNATADNQSADDENSESAAWVANVPLGGALGMVGVARATTFL